MTSPDGYTTTYPGLEGSRVYHADGDCDGDVDSFDIAPFVATLVSLACGVCSTPALAGAGSDFGGALSAEDVATLIAKNLTDDQLAAFMESLAELVAGLGDSPEAEYWAQVLKRLEG